MLGMVPLARELLRGSCEVVMVANAQPAINDVTVWELQALLHSASAHCSLLKVRRLLVGSPAGTGLAAGTLTQHTALAAKCVHWADSPAVRLR